MVQQGLSGHGDTGSTGSVHSTKDIMHGQTEPRMKNNRPLRSWSSSEKSGPNMEDSDRAARDMRRFSVAGPASSSGSRKSHTPRSLPTWAEEDDEMPETTSRGMPSSSAHMARLATAMHSMHVRNPSHQPARHTHANVFVRRAMDAGSSSSSSGSVQQNAHSNSSSSSGDSRHKRLRTPYSISIPSMVGSPLSFTQSFLASRTSMYAKQPPSSQMRAAHIDWDSLSMMEELSNWSSNRADMPVWAGKGATRPHMLAGSGMSLLPHQYVQMPGQIPQASHVSHPAMHHHMHQQPVPMPPQPQGGMGAHAALLNDPNVPANGWNPQAVWDYACYHHPLLASFSVASGLQLSARWRWVLLCVIVVSTLSVLIGTPVILAVLLGREAILATAV
ncbi:hypothetical protein IW139_000251 [Coemansia sp. RSA 353]|nr:hypothetical protein GGH17_000008 [Coemansia sp. RSA 788]KAJ2168906.1 hypothetical protein GGH15_000960 [Coemansia sp. RSA 562]KAJ2191627.1 hypothetical protein EV181_000142 [Coemansia sp. RSA 532]KAJ2200052.1 hypothetical protein GGH18_000101 [Coemansia sp. RSA 530]KAJ2201256.1 hypothetical protein IW144_000485 [Coemansia sp. RSA 522]KAJ2209195.1 hypothetical protein IW145_000139 [Coemansia sp. RSA 521]KAJ2231619.1 hypothetical protein EV180_000226 [Coemansia sp. RSA 518]KAJ2278987.1 hyp